MILLVFNTVAQIGRGGLGWLNNHSSDGGGGLFEVFRRLTDMIIYFDYLTSDNQYILMYSPSSNKNAENGIRRTLYNSYVVYMYNIIS